MPLYEYNCSCGEVYDTLSSVANRESNPCPKCGLTGKPTIGPSHFDYRMGVDPDFPTMADRWAKLQRAKASGKVWDSNNNAYGGEYERTKRR